MIWIKIEKLAARSEFPRSEVARSRHSKADAQVAIRRDQVNNCEKWQVQQNLWQSTRFIMHGTEYSVSGVIRTCKETYQFCLLFMFIEGVHKGKTVDAFFSHRCYVVLSLSHERIGRIEKNSQFYRIIDDLVTHTLPRQQRRNPSHLIVISPQLKPM